MKKQKIIFTVLFFFLIYSLVMAEVSYTLRVLNQQVIGSDFLFEIYLQSTGEDKLYLADSQIYLDFNEENFNTPTITREEKGSALSQYSVSPSIDVNNRFVVSINKPNWETP